MTRLLLPIIALIVCFSLPVFSGDPGEWISPNPEYSESVAALRAQYSDGLNAMLNSFLRENADIKDIIMSPETVRNWFSFVIENFPKELPGDVRSMCIRKISQDRDRWFEVAQRRRLQIAYKFIDSTKIKAPWESVFSVSITNDTSIVIPAPEGFSVFISTMPFDSNLIAFQPVELSNYHHLGNADKEAALYKHFAEDTDADSLEDMDYERKKTTRLRAQNGSVNESVLGTTTDYFSPIFDDTGKSFCFWTKRSFKSSRIEIDDAIYFTAKCVFLLGKYLYRIEVKTNGRVTAADEKWAVAVLTSWRDAIFTANKE